MRKDSYDDDEFEFMITDQEIKKELNNKISDLQTTTQQLQKKLAASQMMIKTERTTYAKDIAKLNKKLLDLQSIVEETIPNLSKENQLLKKFLSEQKMKVEERQNKLNKKKTQTQILIKQKEKVIKENIERISNQTELKLRSGQLEREIRSLRQLREQNLMKIKTLEESCQEEKDKNASLQQKLEQALKQHELSLKLQREQNLMKIKTLEESCQEEKDKNASLQQKLEQALKQHELSLKLQREQNLMKIEDLQQTIESFESMKMHLQFKYDELKSQFLQLNETHQQTLDANQKLRISLSTVRQDFFTSSQSHISQQRQLQIKLKEKEKELKLKQETYSSVISNLQSENLKFQAKIMNQREDLQKAFNTITRLHSLLPQKERQ